MKNRDYKDFAPGEYYHVFNRGNGKMDIFEDALDYNFFLRRLAEYLFPEDPRRRAPSARYERKSFPEGAFTLVSYCLMPNHFHLLLRQNSDVPISSLMLNMCSGYSKYFNKSRSRVGSLFQDQFKAIRVDSNEYLLWLTAYIHQNPCVAELAVRPEDYSYSSYPEYLGKSSNALSDKGIILDQFSNVDEYKMFVTDSVLSIKQRKDIEHLLID